MRSVGLVLSGIILLTGATWGTVQALSPDSGQNTPPPVLQPARSEVCSRPAQVPSAVVAQVPQNQVQIQLSFAPVVRATAPAVASIYARRVVQEQQSPIFSDPLFGQLFGGMGRSQPRVQNALGSGVILSPDGIVVTNFHVVGNADDIRVVLNDRREFDADVILQDQESDLAVLRLRGASNLPAIQIADSDRVEVGDLVLAIGNPFGVGQTVSSGIVSALARSGIGVGSGRGYFIQTDAAINPGNSGGALVDMQGHLVGINSAILTRSGGSNGIGFAIPANLVSQVVAQAENGQTRFQRPWMGVSGQAVDASLAEGLGLGTPQGVAITTLHPQSPLAQAGLVAGDVVLAVDGEPVNSPQEMMFRLAARGVGGSAQVAWVHAGTRQEGTVALVAPPETPERARLTVQTLALRGLVAETINPAVAAEHGLDPQETGVIVIDAPDIAGRIGLMPGDVVHGINRQTVQTTADLDRALRDPTRYWEIDLERDGQRSLLRFRL